MTAAPAANGLPALLDLRPVLDLDVDVGAAIEIGDTGVGIRRLVPIHGGRARGIAPPWQARVLPGGTDFQQIAPSGCATLDARYVLETDAGERIYIVNRAVRAGTPEDLARLARGEHVDPARIYFRCTPRFETAAPAFRWMQERLFVGTGIRHPQAVVLRIFEVL